MKAMEDLLEVMRRLRDPRDGCPWDQAQTFATIAPYTIEEAFEVADAIERGDLEALREELGDLLFQVVFHARLAEEQAAFDFNGVAAGLAEKMRRRHPHVFGDARIADATAQTAAWESHKAGERAARDEGLLDGVPAALPALARAQKLGRRAARVGFDWPDARAVLDKIAEEAAELEIAAAGSSPAHIDEELGDLLFSIVNFARHLEIDAEGALRRANLKFERRFRAMEAALAASGRRVDEVDSEALERLWSAAKESEAER
ncbi:nucleoside triphosphate pyrophosphohydrolase [Wenzhouxiangella sp. XN24]|uniref:nucleoside triphosphate pyrophosphohydrolase n=1 Tax=Wenzhouxiangella sp. XN24 TaxID=2713569 RepID=UPI0013ED2464|nr:nucleoside triphosphate pyrophosphohydrolase [Wenzhouxiangella sp. XN24]NGX16608.1 nucleoside triphosphate pyrophosphohydrolase [Wenzhouxiangella sp. XN24]